VALLAAASLTLAACGGGGDDSGDDGGNTDAVISVNGSEPQNPLIPTATNETGGGNPIQNLYAGLVAYNADGSTVNEVADSIDSDDSILWTVKLKDWKFTDGSDVTAQSFVRAWNYGADADNAQLNAYFFYPIEGTDDNGNTIDNADEISGLNVVDDKTFTIKLKNAESDFPLRLGYSAYFPLPDAAFGDDGTITDEYGEAPVGNGPYQLADSGWEHDVQISMVPNPDYDGAHKPKNGGLTFKFYSDLDAAYSDLQAGNLDVLDTVPDSALTTYTDDPSVQAFNQPGSVFQSFTIPESLDHFSGEEGNLRRQAISKAINREQITDKIFNGTRTPAKDFTAPVLDGWTEDVEGNEVLEFDEAEAKDLWAQADAISKWDGSFKIAYNTDGGHKAWVDATTNQIKNVLGIDSSGAPFATFDEMRTQITDRTIKTAFRTGWQADYPSMLNYLGPLYGTGAGSNDGEYSNKTLDKTLAEAATAQGDDRYALIEDAQAILFEDLPATPLWYSNVAAAAAEGVENVEFTWQNLPNYFKITK
jgi:oligopeptide transport system substrate-binding protein